MTIALVVFALAPGLFFVLPSLLSTLVHTYEEVFGGKEPFWDYTVELTGIRIPWLAGFVLFFGLFSTLCYLSWQAYVNNSAVCLSLLFGARLGDWALSHLGLALTYKRPNPGLASSWLYLVEAIAIVLMFNARLDSKWFFAGFGVFTLTWIRGIWWNLRHPVE